MIATSTVLAIALVLPAVGQGPLHFDRERLGDVTYEAASAFDVSNDGALDIVSGGVWFEGPEFLVEHKIVDPMPVGDYFDDFSDFPMDVNGDGYPDIVTGGFWGNTLRWEENPAGRDEPWAVHVIAKTGPIERCCFYDIDGDGFLETIPVTSPVRIFRLKRDSHGCAQGEFEEFTIKQEGGGGHGIGFGDVNGDGHADIAFAGGWFEAPADTWTGEWRWHPEWNLGSASVPILVHDVNRDGLADIIVGQAHDYGLDWWEQGKGPGGDRTWTKHSIDTGRSQYHELVLADIDNDREPELITGKRYWAHCGHDPGERDPIGLYYFDIDNGRFVRHTIDYGPPSRASGTGIYLWIADVDGNGWKDIVAPGKEGLYLFRNLGRL